ncbi:MAG TPA: cupredoxin family protein [Burkholderiaceae bacterium]|nr:cupredoxin family protein [Burkholderiaceae bacterium]
MKKRIAGAAIAAAALAVAPAVHAHGADTHGKPKVKHHKANLDPVEKAFGRTGDPAKVARTIAIHGTDNMKYSPKVIKVKQGETIRFVVGNKGKLMHETVLGTMDELKEHAEWMKKNPGMEHEEPYMTHIGPGETGEIIWQFTNAGEFHFACLIPGHFEGGMVGKIVVQQDVASEMSRQEKGVIR